MCEQVRGIQGGGGPGATGRSRGSSRLSQMFGGCPCDSLREVGAGVLEGQGGGLPLESADVQGRRLLSVLPWEPSHPS